MKLRTPAISTALILFCTFATPSVVLAGETSSTGNQIHRLPQKKDGSEIEWYQAVQSFLKYKDCSVDDWKMFLSDFGCEINEYNPERRELYLELALRILSKTGFRFGAHSMESRMAHLNYASALALSEQCRKAWDEYDAVAPDLKVENVDYLVASLCSLGLAFRANCRSSDVIYAFRLGDEIISSSKVTEDVQARFYNSASEAVYVSDRCKDDNIKPFYRYAEKAIQLDEKLGKAYFNQLREVIRLRNIQLQSDEEHRKWAEKHK